MKNASFLFVLAIVFSLFPAGAFAATWSTYGGDASQSFYSPGSYQTAKFQFAWSKTIPTGSAADFHSVAAGDGRVFLVNNSVVSPGESIRAYEATTGAELWSKTYGTTYSNISSPAYDNGIVYFTLNKNSSSTPLPTFNAVDAATGTVVFSQPVSSQGSQLGPPTIFGNAAYQEYGYFGGMRAYNTATGATLWDADVPQQSGWSPSADSGHVYLYLGAASASPGPSPARLYAFNAATGALDYQILDPSSTTRTGTPPARPILGGMGDAFVTNGNTTLRLIRFDLNARAISWQITGEFNAAISIAHGLVFDVRNQRTLEARDQITGEIEWTWDSPIGSRIVSNMVVTDSHVFLSTASMTYAIDLVSHQPVWSIAEPGLLWPLPTTCSISDQMLVTICDSRQ